MKKAVLIYNPRSGRGRAGTSADAVCAVFGEHGYEMKVQPIDFGRNPFDGNEEIDLMVVAGGDGTVNFAVNGMKRKGLDVALGVIPSGTANDFAGALGMSKDVLEAARQIASGTEERIDCGCVNGLYYVNIFSFGLFTTTSQHTSDKRKRRIGKLAYLIEGMKELASMHAVPLHVTADGQVFEFRALMVLIFNGGTAGGVCLAPESSVRDGLFDFILLEKRGFFHSVFVMLRYLCGGRPKLVKHLRARTFAIVSPLDEPTDVDGQPGARFPLHIECLAGMLRVVCPARK